MFVPRKTRKQGKVVRKRITFYFTGKHADLVESRIKTFSIRFPDSKTTNELMSGKAMVIRRYHGNMEDQRVITRGGALITGVIPIVFDINGMVMGMTQRVLSRNELSNLSYCDGFNSWEEFVNFYLKRRTAYSYKFKKKGDTVFRGLMLTWRWIEGLENEGFYSDCHARIEYQLDDPEKEVARVLKLQARDERIHGPKEPGIGVRAQLKPKKAKNVVEFKKAEPRKKKPVDLVEIIKKRRAQGIPLPTKQPAEVVDFVAKKRKRGVKSKEDKINKNPPPASKRELKKFVMQKYGLG
jgi:hypothetical protein